MHEISSRHKSSAFSQYGFRPVKFNGRLVAICRICNRKLQNTAASRLRGHRNVCKPEDSHVLPDYPQSGLSRTVESVPNSAKVCKTEMDEYSEDSMQFIDDESTEKDHSVSRQQISKLNSNDQLQNYDDEDEEANNPLSPTNHANSINTDIDDIILEEDDVLVPKNEFIKDTLKRHRPTQSDKLVALHEEKARAETIYFQKKAAYFQKQTENLDIQRKLMILQAQKLRLEIESIRSEY